MPHSPVVGMRWIRNEKRLAIYARDRFLCVYCVADVEVDGAALDHVHPDGGNAEDNLVTVCTTCNTKKRNVTLGWWLRARIRAGELTEAEAAAIKARVAEQTFLPIERAVGKVLERSRQPKGFGSFGAMAKTYRQNFEGTQPGSAIDPPSDYEDEERLALAGQTR